MERVLRASSSPATPRARGREPDRRIGPPPQPAPPPAPGSRDGELRPAVRRRVRRQPVGAAGAAARRGRPQLAAARAVLGSRLGAKVRTQTRRAGAARGGAGPRSPTAVALPPSLRPRRWELRGTRRRRGYWRRPAGCETCADPAADGGSRFGEAERAGHGLQL